MITMTDKRKLETRDVEKVVSETPDGSRTKPFDIRNGSAKPKSERKLAVPEICYVYELYLKDPNALDKTYLQEYRCDLCMGLKTKCDRRI